MSTPAIPRTASTLAFIITVASIGCTAPQDEIEVEPYRVARIELTNGGVVDFHSIGKEIVVAEVSPVGTPPYAASLFGDHQATPAEIYQALRPGEDIPEELEDDHFRRGSDVEPRDLSARVPEVRVLGACNSDTAWNFAWNGATNLYPHQDNSEYNSTISHTTSIAPAGSAKIFGMCHINESGGDGDQLFTLGTRLGGNQWFWYPSYDVAEGSYLYFTGTTASDQVANAAGDGQLSDYWLAAAWQ